MPWRPKRPPIPWRTLAKVLLPIVALVVAFELGAYVLVQRSPLQRARTLRERAQLHRQVGQLEEAATTLEEAAELLPDDVQAPVSLAQVRHAQGRLDEAERILRAAHASRPQEPAVAVPLARLLLDMGRPLEAAEVLEPELGAIRKVTDPLQRIDALLVAGRAAAGRGGLLQAEALLREATRVGPAPVTSVAKAAGEACLALADLLTRSGRLAAARDALEGARTFTPWDPRIALARARVLELAGHTDEALAQLEPLVAAPAGPDLAAAAAMADVLLRARRGDEVAALASRVSASSAGAELAGAMRAAAALSSGDAARALVEAERFAPTHPSSPAAQLARGRAALAAGAPEVAREALAATLKADPTRVEASIGLLELAERSGESTAVVEQALALLERDATRPWAVRAALTGSRRAPEALARALERLEALAVARPGDARRRVLLGLVRLAAGDAERAGADLEALVGAPDLASASSTLADTPEGMREGVLAVEAVATSLLTSSDDAAARHLAARALERLDRVWLAQALLGAAAADLSHGDAAFRLRLAVRTGALDAGVAALEALRARSPDDPAVLAALGEVRLLAGDLPEAREALELAVEATPTSAVLRARLARACVGLGDAAAASAAYAQARQLDPRLPIAHEDAALPLARGDARAAAGRLQAALEATGDARFALALVAAEAIAGQPRQALDGLRRAAPPSSPAVGLLVAGLLAEAGDPGSARSMSRRIPAPPAVQEASLTDPRAPARQALWALVALRALDWQTEARGRAEAILADGSAGALSLWGAWDAMEAMDVRLASRLGERLRQLAPKDPLIALRLAANRGAAGDRAGDAALVREVSQWTLADSRLLIELGMALERVGEPGLAEQRYVDALAAGVSDPVARNNLACLLASSPRPERRREALVHAREAVRLAPTAAETLDTLGWVHHLLGEDRQAVASLERAVTLLPENATIRFHAAEVLAGLGRVDQARVMLEVALRLPGGWPEEAQARARLEALAGPGR